MKNCFFLTALFISIISYAQVEKPATWTYEASTKKASVGDVIELNFEASIQQGWYMYSVGKFDSAPATTITFNPHTSYQLVGEVKAVGDKFKKDEYIGDYRYFTSKAKFVQKIKILSKDLNISGTYEFSTCSLESGICLPPKDEEFRFEGFEISESVSKTKKALKVSDVNISALVVDTNITNIDSNTTSKNEVVSIITVPSVVNATPVSEENLFSFFLLAFISGLLALVTPCVFPMIPMTVTFFLHSSKKRSEAIFKALLYGFSIIAIYTLIGTAVAKLAGPEAANFLSTHWLPNMFFFMVFVVFALSFLGLFEITLPSWIVNAADRQSDRGGYIGIFFMAFTLVLVSFSCTGPIIGTILVQSAGGAFLRPLVGMFGFSLAFAVPFTLFAIFPNWLKGLPKSGGWLNSVKVVLGFLELALAFKFFSLADQAYHWGLLDRDVNLAIWIAIFGTLSLYLFGLVVLPHDSKLERIGVPRLILGIATLSFTLYLVPGLFGAPLRPLSGYLPPLSTQDFKPEQGASSIPNQSNLCSVPKYSNFLELPHGIQGYFDYKEALACAKQTHKPIFIDFTGHGCVNCREMEANVWSNPEVLKKLKNDFIVLALYVDDKTELPQNEWYTSTYDNKIKKSIGKQNADFQITRYQTNAQPYYVIIDENENVISRPVAYDLDVSKFLDFLNMTNQKL
ncbi:MAG: thioredoxin family protein [Bacteroidota bacterium]|nr:thioredoxin family protein [Bacteroidota bacterium]